MIEVVILVERKDVQVHFDLVQLKWSVHFVVEIDIDHGIDFLCSELLRWLVLPQVGVH